MDVKTKWDHSDDVESLVEAISNCRKSLTAECFSKYGRAKIIQCDAYAQPKIIEFLSKSKSFKATKLKKSERKRPGSEIVGEIDAFTVHKDRIVHDTNVRVIALFDTEEGIPRMWYGNVVW